MKDSLLSRTPHFSISNSSFVRTARPNSLRAWLFKTRRGDHGYLRTLAILRIFAYLGAAVSLYLPTLDLTRPIVGGIPLGVSSIVYSCILLGFSFWNWPLFVSRHSKQMQVLTDLIFISTLWAVSNRPYSNLFMLYLMPIFVSIEFLSPFYAAVALGLSWIGTAFAFQHMSTTASGDSSTLLWTLSSRLSILSGFCFTYLSYLRFQTTTQDEPEQLRAELMNNIKELPIRPTRRRRLRALIDKYVTEAERRARLRGYLADQNISSVLDAAFVALEYGSEEAIREIMGLIAKLLECDAGTFRVLGKDPDGNDSLVLTHAIGEIEPASNEIRYLKMSEKWFVVKAFLHTKTIECPDISSPGQQVVQYKQIFTERFHLRSAVATPFTVRNVRGVVTMYRNRLQAFTKDEKLLLEALSRYLALAFLGNEKRQAEIDSIQREKRLQLLQSLIQLAQFDREEEMLQFVVDKILHELQAEGSAAFLIRGRKLKRKAVAGIGSNISPEKDFFDIDEGIIGKVYRTSEHINRKEAMSNQADLKPESFTMYCEASKFQRIEHVFAAPLKGKYGTFGVLRVSNKLTPTGELSRSGFSAEDVEAMLTVASTVSVTLDRLHQVRRSDLLFELSNKIRVTREPKIALQYIVDHARNLLSADHCGIALFDEEEKAAIVVADSRDHKVGELRLLIPLDGNESIREIRRTLEPVSIIDAQSDSRLQKVKILMSERDIKSIVLTPILVEGKIVGTIGMDSEEERKFTLQEMEICKVIADLCAAVLAQSEYLKQIGDDAVRRERQRLRGSLHDTKGALHAGVMLPLELTQYMLQNDNHEKAPEYLDHIWRCSRFLYNQIDRIMEDVTDPVLVKEGLPAALERYSSTLAPEQVSLDCERFESLDFQTANVLYQIAQEAIANAVKHNKGNKCPIHVLLKTHSDYGEMTIVDEGCGFSFEEKCNVSFGIQHMQEMAKRINGTIQFESLPTRRPGTLINVRWNINSTNRINE